MPRSIPQQQPIMKYVNEQADMIICPDCDVAATVDAIEMTIAHREHDSCNLFIHYHVHCEQCQNYANVVEEFSVSQYQKLVIEDYEIKDLRTEEWINNVQL